MKETTQILREKGLKVTPQRIAVYNMLRSTTQHPNAETIYKTLEPANPTMSLATVYKTLDYFKNDLALLADLMGHESIETTRIYLRRTATEQQAIVDKIVNW